MITVNGREISYKNGMTVADALEAAGEYVSALTLVMVDGKLLPCGQPYNESLVDGTRIELLTIVSGG